MRLNSNPAYSTALPLQTSRSMPVENLSITTRISGFAAPQMAHFENACTNEQCNIADLSLASSNFGQFNSDIFIAALLKATGSSNKGVT